MSHCIQAADAGLQAGLGILARLVLYTSSSKFRPSTRHTMYLGPTVHGDLFGVELDYWLKSGTGSALGGSLYQVLL